MNTVKSLLIKSRASGNVLMGSLIGIVVVEAAYFAWLFSHTWGLPSFDQGLVTRLVESGVCIIPLMFFLVIAWPRGTDDSFTFLRERRRGASLSALPNLKPYVLTVRDDGVYLDGASLPVEHDQAVRSAKAHAADHRIVVRSADVTLFDLFRDLNQAGIRPKLEVSK